MTGAIEWDKIAELLWAAPLAAIAVSVTFSLVIMGLARATDAQREGAGRTAMLHSLVASVAALGFIAVVVFGIVVIVNK